MEKSINDYLKGDSVETTAMADFSLAAMSE